MTEKTLKISSFTNELTTDDSSVLISGKINDMLGSENKILIDFIDVLGITTYCAKNIFGTLFYKLGPKEFEARITFKNLAADKKLIIQQGILDYVNSRRSSQKSASF